MVMLNRVATILLTVIRFQVDNLIKSVRNDRETEASKNRKKSGYCIILQNFIPRNGEFMRSGFYYGYRKAQKRHCFFRS